MLKNYFNLIILIFIISILVSCKTYHIVQTNDAIVQIKYTELDSNIYYQYKPYKDSLDKLMYQKIAFVSEDVEKKQPNSTLGNLMADILLEQTKANFSHTNIDFAILNYGGIRVPSLSKGNIVVNDAYNLMPFENYIGYMNMNAQQIQSISDSICYKGGWPISNISFSCIQKKASNIKINNQSLDSNKTYNMAIIDYVANGGDGMSFLKNIPYNNSGVLFRDAIIQYFLKQTEQINPNKENRILDVK